MFHYRLIERLESKSRIRYDEKPGSFRYADSGHRTRDRVLNEWSGDEDFGKELVRDLRQEGECVPQGEGESYHIERRKSDSARWEFFASI
ncbi:MAG TPA: hypothetical protein VF439_01730 [Candidatus Paceibacterota bacterium]